MSHLREIDFLILLIGGNDCAYDISDCSEMIQTIVSVGFVVSPLIGWHDDDDIMLA